MPTCACSALRDLGTYDYANVPMSAPTLSSSLKKKKEKKTLLPEARLELGLETQSSLTDKQRKCGGKREQEMGINEKMTTDGRYGESLAAVHEKDSWQRHPSQTWRRKRCDGSNLQRHRKRKRGRRREILGSGRGTVAVNIMLFVSRLLCYLTQFHIQGPPFASQPDLGLEH